MNTLLANFSPPCTTRWPTASISCMELTTPYSALVSLSMTAAMASECVGRGRSLVKNGLAAHQRGVLQVPVDADALAQALGEELLALHVDELVLEGGAARVDDQNFHFPISFLLFTIVNCGRGIVLWILLLYPYMP